MIHISQCFHSSRAEGRISNRKAQLPLWMESGSDQHFFPGSFMEDKYTAVFGFDAGPLQGLFLHHEMELIVLGKYVTLV